MKARIYDLESMLKAVMDQENKTGNFFYTLYCILKTAKLFTYKIIILASDIVIFELKYFQGFILIKLVYQFLKIENFLF